MTEKKKRRRAVFNEVLPGKLYQRGRFQSWPRNKKQKLLDEFGIIMVVNLWSKVDPEISNDVYRTYLHFPMKGNSVPPPEVLESMLTMMKAHIHQNGAVLIHCEAGVNRSCFLTACLVADVQKISGQAALNFVGLQCGRVKMNKVLRQYVVDHY